MELHINRVITNQAFFSDHRFCQSGDFFSEMAKICSPSVLWPEIAVFDIQHFFRHQSHKIRRFLLSFMCPCAFAKKQTLKYCTVLKIFVMRTINAESDEMRSKLTQVKDRCFCIPCFSRKISEEMNDQGHFSGFLKCP